MSPIETTPVQGMHYPLSPVTNADQLFVYESTPCPGDESKDDVLCGAVRGTGVSPGGSGK